MSKSVVYLCGAIADCTDSECKDWREYVKSQHDDCLDPMRRDYRDIDDENYQEIVEQDKEDIRNCDILLYNYLKPSVGSSMEVFYAHQLNKKVIIINNSNSILSPWLKAHSHIIVSSLNSALKLL